MLGFFGGNKLFFYLAPAIFFTLVLAGGCGRSTEGGGRVIVDAAGREVRIPSEINRVICSGPGCLRLLTYLEAGEKVVGVDSIERRDFEADARPYALANPGYSDKPLFGEFRGRDNPELILTLDPAPQLIFKICSSGGIEANRLQSKTGLPVVCVDYGKFPVEAEKTANTLNLMGEILKRGKRAREVVAYFEALKKDLRDRFDNIDRMNKPTCYLGGLAHRGPAGFRSTNPTYAPFRYLPVKNVAAEVASETDPLTHASLNREKIIQSDPEYLFVDASSLRLDGDLNALDQLHNHPAYSSLTGLQKDNVFVLFPENFYSQNYGTVFANAYFIGNELFPGQFKDVKPLRKAEEISRFLNGDSAYRQIKEGYGGYPFSRVEDYQ